MRWIKSHLAIVICGAVSLVSVVLIILGIVLCDVTTVMGQDASLVQSLSAGRIPPVNQSVIKHLKGVLDNNTKQVEETFRKLAEQGVHQPLDENLFPEFADQAVPFQFRWYFGKALQQMLETLHAGDRPTSEEIAEESASMEAERMREQRLEALGLTGQAKKKQKVRSQVARPRYGTPGPTASGWQTQQQIADMTPEEMAAEIPAVRLSIRLARSIYCYANGDSFDQRPIVLDFSELPPPVDEFWYAQMALWIQQDMVQAISALNNRVADRLKSQDTDPWVGNLPVKHLRWVAVGGYLPQDSNAMDSSAGRSRGSSTSTDGVATGAALTQRVGSETVDVMRFAMGLVIEARMLPSVIDEICKVGFYTPLLVEYEAVPPSTRLEGYIYGTGPCLQVTLQFEGCFLRNKYEKWMPESVKQAIREGRAVGQSASSGGRGRSSSSSGAGGREDSFLGR